MHVVYEGDRAVSQGERALVSPRAKWNQESAPPPRPVHASCTLDVGLRRKVRLGNAFLNWKAFLDRGMSPRENVATSRCPTDNN